VTTLKKFDILVKRSAAKQTDRQHAPITSLRAGWGVCPPQEC